MTPMGRSHLIWKLLGIVTCMIVLPVIRFRPAVDYQAV
jgi:hypothetical protein